MTTDDWCFVHLHSPPEQTPIILDVISGLCATSGPRRSCVDDGHAEHRLESVEASTGGQRCPIPRARVTLFLLSARRPTRPPHRRAASPIAVPEAAP
jgi:hypothetical protein